MSDLKRVGTNYSTVAPPRAAATKKPGFSNLLNAILATALFRCWHIILFFAGWSTLWTSLTLLGIRNVQIAPTIFTVIGTVLGFVISYRTTASFERYNEGRKLWSQIVLAARTFARTVWFHIPELAPTLQDEGRSDEERKARQLIEKKAAINLVEAFAVAVKHYLRGEQGVYYEDLYPLVKNLPPYALPTGMATQTQTTQSRPGDVLSEKNVVVVSGETTARPSDATNDLSKRHTSETDGHLPLPVTSPRSPRAATFAVPQTPTRNNTFRTLVDGGAPSPNFYNEPILFPAHDPPKYGLFDLFPFSLLVKVLTARGKKIKGKKAARLRARLLKHGSIVSHNVPLEITLYLSSYIAALQVRKIDVATTNALLAPLNNLVDALTGLERILTTPIPFSYSVHLWIVTWLYVLAMPFQVIQPLGWLAIPATVAASFIFFGFLVAGEEIENPFGYDKNDLDLDHFCHNIIRLELKAITSMPVPDPADWAFNSFNDALFDNSKHVTPEEWVKRGVPAMMDALNNFDASG